jgi:hypothetical protein
MPQTKYIVTALNRHDARLVESTRDTWVLDTAVHLYKYYDTANEAHILGKTPLPYGYKLDIVEITIYKV